VASSYYLEAFAEPFFCLMSSFLLVRAEGMPLAQSSLIANKLWLRTSSGFDIKQYPWFCKGLYFVRRKSG
jgi:hypothetical protein